MVVHNKPKYLCNTCGKRFKRKYYFLSHKDIHTNQYQKVKIRVPKFVARKWIRASSTSTKKINEADLAVAFGDKASTSYAMEDDLSMADLSMAFNASLTEVSIDCLTLILQIYYILFFFKYHIVLS